MAFQLVNMAQPQTRSAANSPAKTFFMPEKSSEKNNFSAITISQLHWQANFKICGIIGAVSEEKPLEGQTRASSPQGGQLAGPMVIPPWRLTAAGTGDRSFLKQRLTRTEFVSKSISRFVPGFRRDSPSFSDHVRPSRLQGTFLQAGKESFLAIYAVFAPPETS
jgi:hypothetical protein